MNPENFAAPVGMAPAMSNKQAARRLLSCLGRYRFRFAAAIIMCLGSIALTVLAPALLGRAFDIIQTGALGAQTAASATREQAIEAARSAGDLQRAEMLASTGFQPGQGIDFTALSHVLAIVLGAYFLSQVLTWLHGRVLNDISIRVVQQLREQIHAKIDRLPLSSLEGQSRGELQSHATNDVDNIQQALQQAMSAIVTAVLTLLGSIAMMFWLSWQLALVALIALPLAALLVRFFGTRAGMQFGQQWALTGQVNGSIDEAFTGHDVVVAFGREEHFRQRFTGVNDQLATVSRRAQFHSDAIRPLTEWVSWLIYVGIAVLGALRIANGQMSLGAVTAFIQYSREFHQNMAQVSGTAGMLFSGLASAARVFTLLDQDEGEQHQTAPADLDNSAGAGAGAPQNPASLAFENVSFGHGSTPVLESINLRIDPGQTVAIVGTTGAGKTTLLRLMLRFWERTEGTITLNGTDVTTLTRDEVRSHISLVPQETILFAGTIRENIRYGNLAATDQQIEHAAAQAGLDPVVRRMPEGYDTVLGEAGEGLANGERQLVAIARAILSGRPLMLLDEATSAVDSLTEGRIHRAWEELNGKVTRIVVAHRMSTASRADRIVVMEQGRIVGQGSHPELLAECPEYAQLCAAWQRGSTHTEEVQERFASVTAVA